MIDKYAGNVIMPAPPDFTPASDQDEERLRPVVVKFHKEGANLIVCYLTHGIVLAFL